MQVNFLSKFVLRLFSFFLLILLSIPFALSSEDQPISFGNVNQGDPRVDLKVSDFKLVLVSKKQHKIKVVLKSDSIQWIRLEDIILTPRARMAVEIQGDAKDYHLRYRNHSLSFQQIDNKAHTEFYTSLYQSDTPEIFYKGNLVGRVIITTIANKEDKSKFHQIDYSCSRNGVTIEGMDGEHISIGCRTQRVGQFKKEKPFTEILWLSPNYQLLDKSKSPYIAVFMDSNPVKITVRDQTNTIREFKIKAKIPNRLHRLNIAYGLGPYAFETSFKNSQDTLNPVDLEFKEPMAPAFMLYMNYKLNESSSVRGFDAVVSQRSTFNNLGVYYASDVAKPFDKKLTITTLLGMQHLYFKFDKGTKTINEPIFPQGLEMNYRHAFGIENYLIGGGAFLSTTADVDYQNIWFRFGKDIFWELNYIYWGKEDYSARMWGLSAGFFFGGFL